MLRNIDVNMQQGLYDPAFEHDACGVGLLVNIHGTKSHKVVEDALQVLENMIHRGAEGADPDSGDGAGIMIQVPHEFILLQGIAVPEKGRYGSGLVFMPKDKAAQTTIMATAEAIAKSEGLVISAFRDVPVDSSILGEASKANEPDIKQIVVVPEQETERPLDIRLYRFRKLMENACKEIKDFYIVSLSSKNMTYKGMLTSAQLRNYFLDLQNPVLTSGIAIVHSRFSTNTFPSWPLAQPFRLLGHNGEINTIRGNRLWSEARESVLMPDKVGSIDELKPIVQKGMSDSASLDNVLEFFMHAGMSLPHALAMLVPESFNDKNPISKEIKEFYEYHSILMEAWDGPATLMFSDGRYAGGMLDRNGLRPARYVITKDDYMVVASEAGVLTFPAEQIKEKGRLQPGKMLLVDTVEGRVYHNDEIKDALAAEHPYGEWLSKNRIDLDALSSGRKVDIKVDDFEVKKSVFGYFDEEVKQVLLPMLENGMEPTGSMGNDAPIPLFSQKPQLLFNYFRQQFAQVTNPPIDPIREELVMSLTGYIGVIDNNLIEPSDKLCKMVKVNRPILTNRELDILRNIGYKGFRTITLDATFPISDGDKGLQDAIDRLCAEAEAAVEGDYNYTVLSDRNVSAERAAVPSLLAVAAVHHHLIDKRKRVQTALIVESGEVREVMHFALLLGYGASAVNPYMSFAIINELVSSQQLQRDYPTAEKNYLKAIDKGLHKVISKMGISTMGSYRGAELFESIGLSKNVVDKYFNGTSSKIGGIDTAEIFNDIKYFHDHAYCEDSNGLGDLGQYSYRKKGESHAWTPEAIATLQISTRLGSYKKFKEYSSIVNDKVQPLFIRDRLEYKAGNAVELDKVESVDSIIKRFVTGAMSYGSISEEAHEAMAIAMNRIGGKSNTGEGGENPARFKPREDGTSTRSAIKQVASGRFGVTANYLVNADEIQIKVAQGAKPGEGGQLPGYKVNEIIAQTRHSTPGISLISPPPHHDIYSIEDLAQLIFDLKSVNPAARISVKLVAESGIGTIAAGVAKAKADAIIVSGCEGGTGASPMSSIRHAGMPSEIGLSEVQQTLVLNNLRGRVALQTDGQLKTGRDIVIEALLGADEFGFATSALIVLGCVMMRKCHMNTCPVGVATQNEELRKRFTGRADYLVNFFTFLAEEVREILAEMGYTSLDEIIGRTELLEVKAPTGNTKIDKADLSRILFRSKDKTEIFHNATQEHAVVSPLSEGLVEAIQSIGQGKEHSFEITNVDRAVGATMAGKLALEYGEEGLAEDSLVVHFNGSAGQSFGAFLTKGVSFYLHGEANDYVGKSLSGGKIAILPAEGSDFEASSNVIAGNTILYGASKGELYVSGTVGERFAVRNSGATAVVEGAGDHCCEYMTGGRVVVLGKTGKNFAAGMSGGIAYVWDADGSFDSLCNMEMVELSLVESKSDIKELTKLIQNHYDSTGSVLAQKILASPSEYIGQFIKVMPIEYKKVLHDLEAKALAARIEGVQRDF
ncbi:MAG: glutamate synthase large subunit [Rikenellaceae bacterium]